MLDIDGELIFSLEIGYFYIRECRIQNSSADAC